MIRKPMEDIEEGIKIGGYRLKDLQMTREYGSKH